MAKTTINLSEKANKKVKQYMLDNDISDKRVAANEILENFEKWMI